MSTTTIDLAAAVEQQQTDAARHADIEQRDTAHGGMVSIPDMVAEQQRKAAMRDWRAYRLSVKASDLAAVKNGATLDLDRIDVRRLLTDCRAAVKRFTRLHRFGGVKNGETVADILATDAAMILLSRPCNGGGVDPKTGKRSALLDLGGVDGLPMHRDWLERVEDPQRGAPRWKLSDLAWAALLMAVKEAARAPELRAIADAEQHEDSTDEVDLSAMVEQQQRETAAATRIPDNQAPEVVAAAMDIPLDAARAVVHRAYPHATPRDLAESWQMSTASASVALSRGAKFLREHFSDPATLLDALDAAAATYQREVAAEVVPTLLQWRDDAPELERVRAAAEQRSTSARRVLAWMDAAEKIAPSWHRAEVAAADWRAVYGTPSMERRALDVASLERARRAQQIARRLQRDGRISAWQGLDFERVSASVSRILAAENGRARESASAARSSHLCGATLLMAEQRQSSAPVQRQTRSDRIWTYGLTARADREQRAC